MGEHDRPGGIIFDIQRFAVHDGPGIRTNVFFKGCPLSCAWCCNPESQNGYVEIGYNEKDCIHCESCVAVCPSAAITVNANGRQFDRVKCADCQNKPCAAACSPKAISAFGKAVGLQYILDEVLKDEMFYKNSQGGVTVSGGEPLEQADFLREFLKACRERGLHTAVETCSHCPWESFEKIMDYTDMFLCDIKHMDKNRFFDMTGGDLEVVLENLKKLGERSKSIVVRVPVIPGYNDDENSFVKICEFAVEIGAKDLHLLPYHGLGKTKYDKLNVPYRMKDARAPSQESLCQLKDIITRHGLKANIGG